MTEQSIQPGEIVTDRRKVLAGAWPQSQAVCRYWSGSATLKDGSRPAAPITDARGENRSD
jgi:hypothetical protein